MRGRTTVVLLEPQMIAEDYSRTELVPDWTQDPTEHLDVPASVDPLSSSEAVLTSSAVISRKLCYLPAAEAADLRPTWRVRWRGDDYSIVSDVDVFEGSRGDDYLTVILERISG